MAKKPTSESNSSHRLSVIVPENPFTKGSIEGNHCLCAMDVEKLMEWWPGNPHSPHRDPLKVSAIQRSLDWKRVAQIAAYLLQQEIVDVPEKINKYFGDIYEPKKSEPGRQWPPKVSRVIGYERSVFPTFTNVLIHVNGAKITNIDLDNKEVGAAKLEFDENDKELNFSVIDGQHRINGAYLAICILKEKDKKAKWEIPADIFLDLDKKGQPPTKQAQIFIDVNFNQKKVDRSLVADLYPTARGDRESLDRKERAQDIGRKLMLEKGPLVGMIQIPGIKYGVKDVITLATLNGAIESVLEVMEKKEITSLEIQTDFLVQALSAWFEASGRFEEKKTSDFELDPENVAYQGRVLVSVLTLIPALMLDLRKNKMKYVSPKSQERAVEFFKSIASNAGLINRNVFISKEEFKKKGFLGSGGIGRFRDSLWAATTINIKTKKSTVDEIAEIAEENRESVWAGLRI